MVVSGVGVLTVCAFTRVLNLTCVSYHKMNCTLFHAISSSHKYLVDNIPYGHIWDYSSTANSYHTTLSCFIVRCDMVKWGLYSVVCVREAP